MRISHIAPFAVSAALSRACGRWRRASARSARRFGYSTDAAGRRIAISRSGEAFGDLSGATDSYGYNSRNEVISARRTKNGEIIHGFNEDFEYDPIGNRIWSTTYNELGEPKTSQYIANNLNQYTSRTVPGYAVVRGHADADATVTVNEKPTYRYGEYFFGSDEFDNTSLPVNAILETVAVKPGATEDDPDEIASVTNSVYLAKSPVSYEYDDDGNQTLVTTKTGTWRVTYNGENRPVRWERLNSSTPNSNIPSLITMSFDHQGRRRMYLETAADGSTNRLDRFTYDNYLCVARNRWQPDGTSATDHFVWDPTEPVATRPLAFYQPNASPQLYAHDGNKNVTELVSADNGTITAHYEYFSFGEVILSSGDLALANPFRFSSEYSDDALGLVYYNYRHYEPMTGRWMSRDPIGEGRLCQLYLFCENSFATDSLGLVKIPIAPMIIGGPIVDWPPQEDCSVVLKRFKEWYEGEKRRLLNKDEQEKNWVERLPHCPNELKKDGSGFTSPDSSEWSMTWYFGITQFFGNYHPGGEYELRTKDPAKYGGNGNQCVYDKCGKLITEQPGAGTADWSSPEGEGHSHIRDDVKPFDDARYLESVCGLSGCINKYYEVRPSW